VPSRNARIVSIFMEQCTSAIAASSVFFQDRFADVRAALFALTKHCL